MAAKILTIEGSRIHDIASFYDEINRLFMSNQDWTVGNLDGLNDILYGHDGVSVVWKDAAVSRAALGLETTRAFYARKLEQPSVYDAERARRSLDELMARGGPTYFDIVLEIFSEHPGIRLQLR